MPDSRHILLVSSDSNIQHACGGAGNHLTPARGTPPLLMRSVPCGMCQRQLLSPRRVHLRTWLERDQLQHAR
jgi:hypothetical protein